MATKAASKSTETTTKGTGMNLTIDKEDTLNLPLRGRGFGEEVGLVKTELEACVEEDTIRSFPDIEEGEKEKYARLIRRAGDALGMKVATRYDKNNSKLFWGPEDVMKRKAGSGS